MILLNSKKDLLKITILIFTISTIKLTAGINYVETIAKNGDGMYNIFKRYNISPTNCNVDHFKEINNLKTVERLLIGRKYNLPILKLPFNGRSIASSIPNIDRNIAVKIMNYNKSMYQLHLKKSPYTQNKIVWVIYNELDCGKSLVKSVQSKTRTKSSQTNFVKSTSEKNPASTKIKPANTAPVKTQNLVSANTESIPDERNAIHNENMTNSSSMSLRTRSVPIFGEFSEIRIESDILKDKVYYLVSGHGGPDPGTMYQGNNMTLCEDEYAYDITLRLARKLMEQGANVHLIVQDPDDGIRNEAYLKIDHDERCITGQPLVLNQKLRLTQTTEAVNDLYRKYRNKGVSDNDQLAIHIHVDSRHKDLRQDVFFYYQENNKTSLSVAKNLQKTLDKKYVEFSGRQYTGTVSCRNLFVMRNTIANTVYMELGNIQNLDDQKRFLLTSNRQALAEWLYDGIAN